MTAHHSALVTNTVDVSGHGRRVLPAYKPEDLPIEYVFNTLQQKLFARMYSIVTQIDLIREVNTIFTQMGPMVMVLIIILLIVDTLLRRVLILAFTSSYIYIK